MHRVLELLETREGVHVSELANEFAVSEVTIRQDLSELARQGLVARVRGGVRALQRGQSELAFDVRLRLQADEKRAMARAAGGGAGAAPGGRPGRPGRPPRTAGRAGGRAGGGRGGGGGGGRAPGGV